jgi:rhomboid protease GluP
MQPDPQSQRPAHPLDADAPPSPREQRRNAPHVVTLRYLVRRPYVTYALIAINVLIFALRAVSFEIDIALLNAGANSGNTVFINGEIWRLFTSMFLHASIHDFTGGYDFGCSTHIIFNMISLYIAGSIVERAYGHWRFGLIYLLGGLTGSIFSALLNGGTTLSVGASGAVFAIFGAEFIFFWRHRALLGAYARAQIQSLVMLAIFNAIGGLITEFAVGALRIDNWAHLGGALGGLALAWIAGARYIGAMRAGTRMIIARNSRPLPPDLRTLAGYAVLLGLTVAVALLAFRLL